MIFYSDTRQLVRQAIPSRWLRWSGYISFWLLIGVSSGVIWTYTYIGRDPYSLWGIIWRKIDLWLLWGLLANVILWLAWKFQLTGRNRLRNAIALGAGSLIIVGVYLMLYGIHVELFLNGELTVATMWSRYIWAIKTYVTYWFVVYWAIVAVEHLAGYYRRYLEREQQQHKLEQALADARLQSMRAQLQPHFLFNTLNAISAMIESRQAGEAREMVNKLSDLLRDSLHHGSRQFVRLRDEIKFIRRYLDLIRYRFGSRLQVEIDVPESLADIAVPSLVLQPVVENAIKHGASKVAGDVCVRLVASAEDNILWLRVENPVSGSAQTSTGLGVGQTHLRDRLAYLFGDEASFEFSIRDTRAIAEIRLPIVNESVEKSQHSKATHAPDPRTHR